MPFDWGQCQIPYTSPGPKVRGFQLTGALFLVHLAKEINKQAYLSKEIGFGTPMYKSYLCPYINPLGKEMWKSNDQCVVAFGKVRNALSIVRYPA